MVERDPVAKQSATGQVAWPPGGACPAEDKAQPDRHGRLNYESS